MVPNRSTHHICIRQSTQERKMFLRQTEEYCELKIYCNQLDRSQLIANYCAKHIVLNTFLLCQRDLLRLNFIDTGVLFEELLCFKCFISMSKSQQNAARTCQSSQHSNFNMLTFLLTMFKMMFELNMLTL